MTDRIKLGEYDGMFNFLIHFGYREYKHCKRIKTKGINRYGKE